MRIVLDPTPLAFNAALREHSVRLGSSQGTLAGLMDDGWSLLMDVLDHSRGRSGTPPDLAQISRDLADVRGEEGVRAMECLEHLRRAWESSGARMSSEWVPGGSLKERANKVEAEVEKLLQRPRNVSTLLVTPPLPERLTQGQLSAFLRGPVGLRDAQRIYPPRFLHESGTIVLVVPERGPWTSAELELVMAHEFAHAYLPRELHGFLLSRWEEGMEDVAQGLHVEFREIPDFVQGNVLWRGLPQEHLEAFSEAVATAIGRAGSRGERRQQIREVMERVDKVSITVARIRHTLHSLRVLQVLPSKRLRGTLEKKLGYKRQVSGMSNRRLQEEVTKKRWSHMRALVAELETQAKVLDSGLEGLAR